MPAANEWTPLDLLSRLEAIAIAHACLKTRAGKPTVIRIRIRSRIAIEVRDAVIAAIDTIRRFAPPTELSPDR